MVARGLGKQGNGELVLSEWRVSVWEDEKVLDDGGDGCIKV